MSSSGNWFQDDVALLSTLRSGRGVRTPTMAGYSELKELRRGGQGVVYVARQISTKRRVAIKVLLDSTLGGESSRRRFEREIDLIAGLSHPNIVKVYDSGTTDDGRSYYVMEFIDGASMDELIASTAEPTHLPAGGLDAAAARSDAGPVAGTAFQSIDAALRVFTKICDAVNFAHQRGVIHRDLKPSNVRIDPRGEPHVLDFGLAKLADSSADPEITQMSQTGNFMGSLPWASPEQTEGSPSRIDIRTDVYSLGVMLFQLLTGRFPYPVVGSLRQILENIQRVEPRRPSVLRREIDEELETIILKCLAKEPERRYQSAGDLARDLRSYTAGEPIAAKRDSAWYGLKKNLERYRVAARLMSVTVIGVLVFAAAMSYLWQRAVQAEQLATQRLEQTEAARLSEQRARVDAELARLAEEKARLESDAAREAETLARVEAERAAEEARRTGEFLERTLQFIDPWKHVGRDVTPMREMLDKAAERVETELTGFPQVQGVVHQVLGWDYWELGLLDAAEPHLVKANEIFTREFGDEHPRTLVSLNNLAMFVGERGQRDKAIAYYERALAGMRNSRGEDDKITLRAANNLAAELADQARYPEAEVLARETLARQQAVFGEDSEEVTAAMNTLVTALNGLGKYAESIDLSRRIVEIRTRVFGATAPPTLKAIGNLGYAYSASGRLGEAEALLRQTHELLATEIGPNHPTTIAVTSNLANVLEQREKFVEAESYYRQALEAQRAFSGDNTPDMVRRLNNLGNVMIHLKRPADAEPVLREALALAISLEGETAEITMSSRNNLAILLEKSDRKAEAENLYRFAYDTRRASLGAAAETTMISAMNLGLFLIADGRAAEAEPLLGEAAALARANWPEGHWFPAAISSGYGRCIAKLGRDVEGEKLLLDSLQVFTDRLGPNHDRSRKVMRALAEIYESRGDTARAEEYTRRAATQPSTSSTE